MTIEFDNKIITGAPALRVILVEAEVVNPPTPDALWGEIEAEAANIHKSFPMESVRLRPAIDATRAAYKAFGKDPNRYRPSAEALMRQAVKEMALYRTLAIIDLINLLSMRSGHSIGGFDADKIEGDTLTLGVGEKDEPYEAIGRGLLNIEGLPVFRDSVGGIGTPTSDNERTKLSEDTRRLLMTINMYGDSEMTAEETENMARELFGKYAGASDIRISYWKP